MVANLYGATGDTSSSTGGSSSAQPGGQKEAPKETEGLNEEADVLLAPKLVGEEGQVRLGADQRPHYHVSVGIRWRSAKCWCLLK
jgi:hypothetical protein